MKHHLFVVCILATLLIACKAEQAQTLEGEKFTLDTTEKNQEPEVLSTTPTLEKEADLRWISDVDGFEEIANYPITYSHEPIESKVSLRKNIGQQLQRELYETLLPNSLRIDSTEAVYPMHRCAQKMYTLATYLVRNKDPMYINEPYTDEIHLVVYDQGDSIVYTTGGRMKDEYDSFYDISITSSTSIISRYCDREYSPDEEQEKEDLINGSEFMPLIHQSDYEINLDNLQFESVNESSYVDSTSL